MRYLLTLFLLCAASVLQAQVAAEEIRINDVFRKAPLSRVFKTIQEKYNINIAYDNTLVQNIVVALHINNLNLTQCFELLLAETPLTYRQVGNNVIIIPKPQVNESKPVKTEVRLAGVVIDASNNETLPQATISVRGTSIATTSNNDGYFTLLHIPYDTCLIEIRYLGYITQSVRVKDIPQMESCAIQLKSDAEILNEVVVTDEYNQALHTEEQPGAFVFNPRSLSTLPSLGEQDISRTLQLIPGVTATDESSSGMIIRGSHSSYNLTLLDGMTIYQQDHFFGSFSIINSDIIKDVRVHKGMFDAKYGGRVSGVIDITSKNGNTVKPAFNVKVNMINVKASVEIPVAKKWSLFVAGRRSFTDVIQSSLFNTLFGIARTSNDQVEIFRFVEGLEKEGAPRYHFYDVNSKLTFRPSTRDVLSLSLYASRDKMTLDDSTSFGTDGDTFIVDSKELTRWGNNGLSLRWARQWNDRYYSNVRISDSRFFRMYDYQQEVQLDMIASTYFLGFENNITDLTYALDNEWLLRDKLSFNWGLTGVRQKTYVHIQDRFRVDPPQDEMPEDTNSRETQNSWQHSLYGSINISPVSRLTISGGGRIVHYHNKESKLFAEPRFTLQYQVKDSLTFKTGYAHSNQFITQLFYYSHTGSISGINENFWMLSQPGDVRYPVISSDHLSTGVTLKRKQVVYDAEVYYKVTQGVILDEDLNSGNTNMYGLDLMIQKISGIHRGWIAYSLAYASQKHPYIFNGDAAPTWQDQRHELKVAEMLMLGNWNLSSTLIFGSGKPYAKYDVKYLRNTDNVITDYALQLDYSNQSRLPAYFRIDLSVSYSLQLKNSGKIEMALSVHNLTDNKNIKTRRIDTEKLNEAILTNTELPADYHDVVLLGFSPTLSISVSF